MAYTGQRYYDFYNLPVVGDRVCMGSYWRRRNDGTPMGPRVGIVIETRPMTGTQYNWIVQKNFKVQWASGKVTWVAYGLLWHLEWLDNRKDYTESIALIHRQACEYAHQNFRQLESSMEISKRKIGA